MPLSVAELFAGVGGFRIGFENTTDMRGDPAFEVVWSNQWEPSTKKQHASEVYVARWEMEVTEDDDFVYVSRKNSSDLHVNKDINTIGSNEIPDIDVLCGGFPCQDYSVAKTADKAKGIQGKRACFGGTSGASLRINNQKSSFWRMWTDCSNPRRHNEDGISL